MCSTHWPVHIDMTRDDSKRLLRRLELEAYASLVSALRARGELTPEKKKMLHELQQTFSISTERHRAEVRRAVNDEKLSTIAQHMNTNNSNAEWLIEGRRAVPLMPRLVPQTAFTPTANNAALNQVEKNLNLPSPAFTGKDIYAPPPPETPTTTTPLVRPPSPPNNVVVLPSGLSIHIQGGLSTEDDELQPTKRRRRSSSADSIIITKTTSPIISMAAPHIPLPQSYFSSATTQSSQLPPVRVTVAKSPGKLHVQGGQQKVVVVSAANTAQASTSLPNIIHRPYTRLPHSQLSPRSGSHAVHFPSPRRNSRDSQPISQPYTQPHIQQTHITRTGAVTSMTSQYPRTVTVSSNVTSQYPRAVSVTSQYPRAVTGTSMNMTSQYPKPVTMTTNASGVGMKLLDHIVSLTTTANSMPSVSSVAPQVLTTAGQRMFPRTRTIITRPRAPLHQGHRSTIVIPPGGQPMHSPQIYRTTKSNVQIKQEGSMKIITQAVGGPSAKLLPKPSSSGMTRLLSDSGAPTHAGSTVVVVTTVPSSVTMAARASITASGGKIVNMGGTRVISTSGSKQVQITAVKASHPVSTVVTPSGGRVVSATTGKPNVIVVQKGAPTRKLMTSLSQSGMSQSQAAMSQTIITPKSPPPMTQLTSGFEKDYISFIEKQGSTPVFQQAARPIVTPPQQQQKSERRLAPRVDTVSSGQSHKLTVIRQRPDGTSTSQPMVLTASHVNKPSILTELIGSRTTPRDQRGAEKFETISEESQAVASISGYVQKDGSSQIIDLDADESILDLGDSSAIRALLDLQQGSKVRTQGDQPRGDIITVDESGQIIEQVVEQTSADGVRYIKTDQGTIKFHPDQPGGIITETGQPVQIEIASEEELHQIANTAVSQDIIGELDPDTGILYTSQVLDGQQIIAGGEIASITPLSRSDGQTGMTFTDNMQTLPEGSIAGKKVLQQQIISHGGLERHVLRDDTSRDVTSSDDDVIMVQSRDVTPTSQQQTSDFLTSALTHAQIDLQPYQFMEEDEPTQKQTNQESEISTSVIQTDEGDLSYSTASETETAEIQPRIQSIAIVRDVQTAKPTHHAVSVSSQSQNTTAEIKSVHVPVSMGRKPEIIEIQTPLINTSKQRTIETTESESSISGPEGVQETNDQVTQEQFISDIGGNSSEITQEFEDSEVDSIVVSSDSVRVESTGISQLSMSDLSSQQDSEMEYSSSSYSSAMPGTSSQDSVYEGIVKRKRKPPMRTDDVESHVTSWARQALSLLQKVARYRGMYKQKGDIPAASWFTQPVDPTEVPDYYNIVTRPIDFSTIKRNIEANEYMGWEDFHEDMLLVRENCYAYNPEGSEVRLDCDEVFTFYMHEYDKSRQKWSQGHTPSPKKIRMDRSPIS